MSKSPPVFRPSRDVVNGIYINTLATGSTIAGFMQNYDVIAQQGGTYSGKTFGIMVGLHLILKTESNFEGKPITVTVVGQSVPHLKDGAMADYEAISTALGGVVYSNTTDRLFRYENGNQIKFLSVDKLGKAKGAKRDILFVNECNELDYTIVKQLMLRTNMSVILDWNPSSEFWFHDKVVTDPDKKILYKRSTYKDNPAVSEKKIRDIEALRYTDPELYRVYALGLTGKVQGLIYDFSRSMEWPKGLLKRRAYGMDFGYTNDPTVLVEAGLYQGNLYARELIFETGLTDDLIIKGLVDLGIPKNIDIWADSSDPKTIATIAQKGWSIKGADKGPDSIVFGINTIKRYPLKVSHASVNMLKEFQRYKWKEKDGVVLNKPIDKYDHCSDSLRYYAMMTLGKPEKRKARSRSQIIN